MIAYFDLLIVVLLVIFLVKDKQFLLLNPAFLYLMIHVFFVTFRGVQIFILNKIIVTNNVYDSFLTLSEISKAIFLADIGLISFFIGFNLLKSKFRVKGVINHIAYPVIIEKRKKPVDIYILVIFILGIIGLFLFAFIPGRGKNQYEYSILTESLANLSIISSVIIIYQKGFKKVYVLYFILLVIIYSLQGYARFRAILPLVFIMLYYLKFYKLKLPPVKYVIIGFLVFLISIPLKQIGLSVREGDSVNVAELVQKSLIDIVAGESGELALVEQSAAMIGNIDKKDKIFYGETYSSIFFFFIPRAWWKEKPALNQWQHEISDSGRRFSEMGQISLITGEAYANFRIPGVIVVMMLLGLFYSYLFFSFSKINMQHKGFLLLLLFDMLLYQIWRDGLISLFLFPLLNYLPITILYFIKKHPKTSLILNNIIKQNKNNDAVKGLKIGR